MRCTSFTKKRRQRERPNNNMKDMNTIAALDIGTNAVRFLICNIEEYGDTKKFRKVAFLRAPIRLGEDVFSEGYVSERRIGLLCEAMQGFAHLMKAFCVKDYRACATSAMREAENGDEVISRVKKASGIKMEIIPGTEEAQMIFTAGLPSGGKAWGDALHVDVGGGSTEVVVYADGEIVDSRSFPLGTVRYLKDAVKGKDEDYFKSELKKIGEKYRGDRIVGSGGNINKAQKLLNKRAGEPLSFVELKMLHDTLKGLTFEDRMKYFKLNPYRADVIIPALKIFLTVSKLCHSPMIFVPQVGLVDGIAATLCAKQK